MGVASAKVDRVLERTGDHGTAHRIDPDTLTRLEARGVASARQAPRAAPGPSRGTSVAGDAVPRPFARHVSPR